MNKVKESRLMNQLTRSSGEREQKVSKSVSDVDNFFRPKCFNMSTECDDSRNKQTY